MKKIYIFIKNLILAKPGTFSFYTASENIQLLMYDDVRFLPGNGQNANFKKVEK